MCYLTLRGVTGSAARARLRFRFAITLVAALGLIGFLIPDRARASGVCAGPTLATLEADGTCTLGDLTISGFGFNLISGNVLSASDIGVTPITSEPDGFTFTIPESSVDTELVIDFLASNTNGTIDDLSLALSSGFSGSVENVCVGAGNIFAGPNGAASCSNTSNTEILTAGFGNPLSTSSTFSAVSAVDTSNGFIIGSGSSTGSLTEQISEIATPEPQTRVLLFLALLAFALANTVRARRARAQ
jgi:hypothetical protein